MIEIESTDDLQILIRMSSFGSYMVQQTFDREEAKDLAKGILDLIETINLDSDSI